MRGGRRGQAAHSIATPQAARTASLTQWGNSIPLRVKKSEPKPCAGMLTVGELVRFAGAPFLCSTSLLV
jgi:hypothetical protein